ncbi:hypothetical protein WA588_004342 [Blastocystis sp. NMH]
MGFNSSESDEDAAAVETMIIDFDPTEFEGLVTETQETSEGNLSDDSEFEKNNLYDPHVMEEKSTYGSYLQYSYAVKSHKGYFPFEPLKVNQDYTISCEDASTESLIFAVFDGHGEFGHFVSGVHPGGGISEKSRKAVYPKVSDADKSQRNNRCDMHRDSRAILAVKDGNSFKAEELTRDHTPSLPEEKKRILAAGGRVFALHYEDGTKGPERVWIKGRNLPGLAMTRSLCDVVAHSVGVSSMPEITERILTEDDRVLILASDGLCDIKTGGEQIVQGILETVV